MAYNGTVELAAGIKPKNNGSFPMVAAHDVYVDDSTRLDAKLDELEESAQSSASIAPTEASSTAASAHAIGEYFFLGGTLFEVTAAIAVGDTIAVGTNVKAVPQGVANDLAGDVSELKGAVNDICTATGNKNVADKSTKEDGYYYTQAGKGGGGTYTGYTIFAPIKLTANTPYTSSHGVIRYAFAWLADSIDGVRTALNTLVDGTTVINVSSSFLDLKGYTPSTDKYLFLTLATDSSEYSTFMLVDDSVLPLTYKEYNVLYNTEYTGYIADFLLKDQGKENVNNVVAVDSNGVLKTARIGDVDKKYYKSCNYQFITPSNYIYGYYTASNNVPVLHTNTTDYYCQVIVDMKPGTYYFRNLKHDFCYVRTNGVMTQISNDTGNITIDDISDLYITVSNTVVDSALITDNQNLPNFVSYGAYNIQYESNAFKGIMKGVVRVEKDGSGDYTKLTDAIAFAQKNKNTTIYVGPGEYDILTELGDDYISAVTGSGRPGLQIGNGMHIIFSSNSKVVSHYTGNNQYMYNAFSPFNNMVDTSGFILENLVLECSNCRYGVHDETTGQTPQYKNEYRNCSIVIDNSGNTHWGARQCIGGGLGKNSEIIIDGCYFESKPNTALPNGTGIVSYHNATGANANDNYRSNIVIKNSYFAGNDTVKVSYLGAQTIKSRCIVSGCSVGSAPYVVDEAGSGSAENMELLSFCNEIRT